MICAFVTCDEEGCDARGPQGESPLDARGKAFDVGWRRWATPIYEPGQPFLFLDLCPEHRREARPA